MDAATYRRARLAGYRAADAIRLARWIAEDRLSIEPDSPLTIERDGFDVAITARADEYVDLADMGYGTFEDGREDWRSGYWHAESPGAIPNTNRDSRSPGGGSRFYIPSQDRAELVAYHRKAGASKSVALDLARESEAAELAALSEWGPAVYVLTVKASRNGITLGRASCGMIEIAWSDITRTDGTEYLAEIADDLIPEAIAEAREALKGLAVA